MAFTSPNYTQTPNDLFDDLLKDITDMSELKVTLVGIRQTFGYHRERAELSQSFLEQATGMARNSVKRGIFLAIERGTMVQVKEETNNTGAIYAMSVVEGQPLTGGGSAIDRPEGQPLTPNKEIETKLKKGAEPLALEEPLSNKTQCWRELQKALESRGEIHTATRSLQEWSQTWDAFPDNPEARHAAGMVKLRAGENIFRYFDEFRKWKPAAKLEPAIIPKAVFRPSVEF